jgi:hypothetical protein
MIRRWGWRGWLVTAALVAAALACSVEVSTTRFESAALFKDPGGVTRTRNFAPQDTVYCLLQLKNAPDTTRVKAVWIAVAAQDQPPNSTISQRELQTGSAALMFEAAPPDGGWPPGDYRVELYLNGDRRQTLDFKIK